MGEVSVLVLSSETTPPVAEEGDGVNTATVCTGGVESSFVTSDPCDGLL